MLTGFSADTVLSPSGPAVKSSMGSTQSKTSSARFAVPKVSNKPTEPQLENRRPTFRGRTMVAGAPNEYGDLDKIEVTDLEVIWHQISARIGSRQAATIE